MRLSDKRKYELAHKVAERFYRLKDGGKTPYTFAYNSYAVVVSYHERYWGLAIYNQDGDFVTNIAT